MIKTVGTRTFREAERVWYLCLPCVLSIGKEPEIEDHKIYSHTNKNHLLPAAAHWFNKGAER